MNHFERARLARGGEELEISERRVAHPAEDARRQCRVRDAFAQQRVGERRAGQQLFAVGEVQAAAGGERHEDLDHRRVEANRREVQHAALGGRLEDLEEVPRQVRKSAVRIQRALRLAGRARRVNQIRGLLRFRVPRFQGSEFGGSGFWAREIFSDDKLRVRVVQHPRDAIARVVWIDRQEHCAEFECGECADDPDR